MSDLQSRLRQYAERADALAPGVDELLERSRTEPAGAADRWRGWQVGVVAFAAIVVALLIPGLLFRDVPDDLADPGPSTVPSVPASEAPGASFAQLSDPAAEGTYLVVAANGGYVQGRGFAPGESVTLVLPDRVEEAAAITDVRGSFEVDLGDDTPGGLDYRLRDGDLVRAEVGDAVVTAVAIDMHIEVLDPIRDRAWGAAWVPDGTQVAIVVTSGNERLEASTTVSNFEWYIDFGFDVTLDSEAWVYVPVDGGYASANSASAAGSLGAPNVQFEWNVPALVGQGFAPGESIIVYLGGEELPAPLRASSMGRIYLPFDEVPIASGDEVRLVGDDVDLSFRPGLLTVDPPGGPTLRGLADYPDGAVLILRFEGARDAGQFSVTVNEGAWEFPVGSVASGELLVAWVEICDGTLCTRAAWESPDR